MEYNATSQPVGLSANKFRREIGKIIRNGTSVHLRAGQLGACRGSYKGGCLGCLDGMFQLHVI